MNNEKAFDRYVRLRLESWGREFALHRNAVRLGFPAQNFLQVLFDYRGRMPRGQGFKPEEFDLAALEIEDIVVSIHATARLEAVVLRAYYCGTGRAGFERREMATELFGAKIAHNRYFDAHKRGFEKVASALTNVAKAA